MRPSCDQSTIDYLVTKIFPGDSRQIQRRLQELSLPACCSIEGKLKVEVKNELEVAQVRSVLQQFVASRAELVDWLEVCWQQSSPD